MRLHQQLFLVVAIQVMLAGSTSAAPLFLQDFETDAAGWIDLSPGSITQVSSGTNGINSSDGSGHAEVALGTGAGTGAFTRFGGYSYTWPGGFIRQSLDVYIDPSSGAIGDNWALDNAVNDDNNNNTGITGSDDWREAGGVGVLKATDGNWWLTADADGAAYQGPASGGVGLEIDTAGWYTIVSEWIANPDGMTVDRNTFVYDSSNALLYSNFNLQQVPLTGPFPLGGWRYGWLRTATGNTGVLTLAIDNSQLEISGAAAVPEPSSLALLAIGCAGLIGYGRRRRKSQDSN